MKLELSRYTMGFNGFDEFGIENIFFSNLKSPIIFLNSYQFLHRLPSSFARRMGIYNVQGHRFVTRMESSFVLQYHDIFPSLASEKCVHSCDNRNIQRDTSAVPADVGS